MKILKPVFYTAVAGLLLTSCKSISSLPVPVGSDVVVNATAKKGKLSDTEKDNWQHLDLVTDSIPGMSVNKAYEFLKGKKGIEVIVGVVDSGTDLKHEDLVDVAWVNKKEIPGNGIDDDKNGYIDDINGWNFLGKSYKEHLEYERILMNPSIADAETLAEVKKFYNDKIEKAKKAGETLLTNKNRYEQLLQGVKNTDEAFAKHFGKKDYTTEEVLAIKTEDESLLKNIAIAKRMFSFGLPSLADAKKELEGGINYFIKQLESNKKLISGESLKTDYRTAVGDNAYDIKDKPGSGDGNTGHSIKDEAHGSHVSGIIGATRNNGKGMNGVANNVKIMAVRSVSDGDEYDKDVALAIRYAVDNGAQVINMSFGKSYTANKKMVDDAMIYAQSKGVLLVHAAGNDARNIDTTDNFPTDILLSGTRVNNLICVGASTISTKKKLPAGFSNYGNENVDIFAPGLDVVSTTVESEYEISQGTSFSAPVVSGVAALVWSYYPDLTATQMKEILIKSATNMGRKRVFIPGMGKKKTRFRELSVSDGVVNTYNAFVLAAEMSK